MDTNLAALLAGAGVGAGELGGGVRVPQTNHDLPSLIQVTAIADTAVLM
jgi:hypothetical protein